ASSTFGSLYQSARTEPWGVPWVPGTPMDYLRYSNIIDVEELLRRLCDIKIGNENLRVYLAYDRRTKEGDGWRGNKMSTRYAKRSGETLGNGTRVHGEYDVRMMDKRFDMCDNRRYNDVVNGKKQTTWYGKKSSDDKPVAKENMVIEIGTGDIDTELLCQEETVKNILQDTNHGIRRWVHNLRMWNENYKQSGRLTWINIVGIRVSCWRESVFKRIAEWHGIVVEMNNCKLEEEIRDIVECKLVEMKSVQKHQNEKENNKGIDHMEADNDEDETDQEDKEDDDYEGNGKTGDSNGDNSGRGGDGSDTFEDEKDISYAKAADGSLEASKDVGKT
ncbi:hypothetical protein Tco_1139958, partial [Tanacetum coccineum]